MSNIEELIAQRDDAIKIAMLILEHSTVNAGDSSKHVHKYAVDMLGVLRHKIPYELSTNCDKMNPIYNKNGYHAWIDRNGVVVVHRLGNVTLNATHVGEKHPSQDWREVKLFGCPDDIRAEIIDAHKKAITVK